VKGRKIRGNGRSSPTAEAVGVSIFAVLGPLFSAV